MPQARNGLAPENGLMFEKSARRALCGIPLSQVVAITTDGAEAHIDRMAQKYLGQETYPFRQPGEVRVLYHIAPDKVVPFAS